MWLVFSLALTVFPELAGAVAGTSSPFAVRVARLAFFSGVLGAAWLTQPRPLGGARWRWPWASLAVLGLGLGGALVYWQIRSAWAGWVFLGCYYVLLLGLDAALSKRGGIVRRWAARGLLVLGAGATPVAIAEVESRFADEEFFALVTVVVAAVCWLLLVLARALLVSRGKAPVWSGPVANTRTVGIALLLVWFGGLCVVVRAYQHSFYPPEAPQFDGISADSPFICGTVEPDGQVYDGETVFGALLEAIEANPDKGPPEYAVLALGTGEARWAGEFRDGLLGEASEGRFAGASNSMKSAQYEAALRAYYLPLVEAVFPGLLTTDDLVTVRQWLQQVNERAMTVEWVDLMYGLALAEWPDGPYENQEIGAGLLSVLELHGLSAPHLSAANAAYLEDSGGGWDSRWRNNDDAFGYQSLWITNAYFQSLRTGRNRSPNVGLSFEWLLLQTLPDGAPLRYNHRDYHSVASSAYLAATLLEDPQYVWLAGRALDGAADAGVFPLVQPGVESPVSMLGSSPTVGSCIMYGESGLPNQAGPLAPDKIVFRDGWAEDSAYVLLNLRFTGWHRYRATNTVSLVYQRGALAADALDEPNYGWLPVGRSAFRDKRVPRENLNGLLVQPRGMTRVLSDLTGIGVRYAQDPPHYAEVAAFETGEQLDWSLTRITDWQGWQHDRYVFFFHDGGPIAVVDQASGPPQSRAALSWNLVGAGAVEDQRIALREGDSRAEFVILPLDGGDGRIEVASEPGGDSNSRVVYYSPAGGRLEVVTLFLLGDWVGAEVEYDPAGQAVLVGQDEARVSVPVGRVP